MNFINENVLNRNTTFPSEAHKSSTILLIGNDQRLSDLSKHQLHNLGYKIKRRRDDESVVASVILNKPDLVILDIGFRNLSMLSVITHIRAVFSGPLLLLTSRNSEQEQIVAFNLGADEYLTKPISQNILNVRIDALLKRYTNAKISDNKIQIHVGNLHLSPSSFKCQLGDKNIPVTQFEFKLLRLLAENVGKVMSRDRIYTSLLGREYNGSERTVDVRVSQLREKLGLKSLSQIRIETIWGQGYMLSLVN